MEGSESTNGQEPQQAKAPPPLEMPAPIGACGQWAERCAHACGAAAGAVAGELRRFGELLRAAGSDEGRRRELIPLVAVTTTAGFLLGLRFGFRRNRRRRG